MGRLRRLLQERLVNLEDVLYFTFKKHVFTGHVTTGGLIWNCTWQKPGEGAQDIFKHTVSLGQQPYVRTFESLTDWTETCIQECLDEYHTRYSSWKRVRHQLSDKPMEVLFKNLQMRDTTPVNAHAKPTLLFERIASQRAHIEVLTQHIKEIRTWFAQKYPDQQLPQGPLLEQENPCPETPAVQPFLLNSEQGQYVVLHRLNQVAPQECISWLKQNGPESFKERLNGLNMCFEPKRETTRQWKPVDPNTCKHFLHQFFKN